MDREGWSTGLSIPSGEIQKPYVYVVFTEHLLCAGHLPSLDAASS